MNSIYMWQVLHKKGNSWLKIACRFGLASMSSTFEFIMSKMLKTSEFINYNNYNK
jgi:hypothetical protein